MPLLSAFAQFCQFLFLCVYVHLQNLVSTQFSKRDIYVQLLDTYIRSYSLLEIERHRNEFTMPK